MKKPKYEIGAKVYYTALKISGAVTKCFPESDSPRSAYRYYVKTRFHTFSVAEQDLDPFEMQKVETIFPVISSTDKPQNEPDPAA